MLRLPGLHYFSSLSLLSRLFSLNVASHSVSPLSPPPTRVLGFPPPFVRILIQFHSLFYLSHHNQPDCIPQRTLTLFFASRQPISGPPRSPFVPA
ncbi:hypothetical protein F4802DRAFT_225947 [Xylaria palmicola]|nr:hypothetical protein F4802DRAFT_225947 [Xylaria palmicola]